VEAGVHRVEALFEAVDNNAPERIRPCQLKKLVNFLKLRKACGIEGIPNECLRHLPRRRPMVHWTHLLVFNHCFRLSHFPKSLEEVKFITLPKPGKFPKFHQILPPISPLFQHTNSSKSHFKIVQKYTEERGLLNASQFGFRVRHSTILQCTLMRLTHHVILNFNNNMSTAAVFLDIEIVFDTHGNLVCYISYPNWNFRSV
jgi:hypothetical protein